MFGGFRKWFHLGECLASLVGKNNNFVLIFREVCGFNNPFALNSV